MDNIPEKTFKTAEVAQSIQEFADDNALKLHDCDFTILSTETYLRYNATKERELISQEILVNYLDEETIRNKHINFHQVHNIKVFHKQTCTLKLEYKIDFGDYATHPKILLSAKSHIPYKLHTPKKILNLLFRELSKIKIYNKILIHMFDENMKKNLKAFVKYLYAGKFKKTIKLPLFDGIKPVMTREAKLIYWYKEKETQSAVVEVEADEKLIEFKKPIFGKGGFNAFGEELSAATANNLTAVDFEIDKQSVKIVENENAKLYISLKKGFVHFENNKLAVDNTIKVAKISRNNLALASEEENNIQVVVTQNDTNKDSVGEGVELVSEIINVKGFVGANSKLEAIQLNVDGATHQDAKQYAKFAKINRHKGTLRCHDAKINLLEGGEVHATHAHIETCLGGTIYAQDVTIGHVKNNLKVYASNSIKIRLVSGEDNSFIINYKKIPILLSKIEFLRNDIEDLKYKLEQATRHNKKEVPKIKEQIATLKDEIQQIQNSHKTAKISIEKPLRGLNKIIYHIDDENELIYKTQAQEYSEFYLEIDENKITLQPVNVSLRLEN
jgi:hypothetical protein